MAKVERTPTPEELAAERARVLSDAEKINAGAKFVVDKGSRAPRLEVMPEQVEQARGEMEKAEAEGGKQKEFVAAGHALVDLHNELFPRDKRQPPLTLEMVRLSQELSPEIFNDARKDLNGMLGSIQRAYERRDSELERLVDKLGL